MESCRVIDRNQALGLTVMKITATRPGHFEVATSGFWTFMEDDSKGLHTWLYNKELNIDFQVDEDTEVVQHFVRYVVKSGKLFLLRFIVTQSTVSRVPVTLIVIELPAMISYPDPHMETFGGSPIYMERSWLKALSKVFETEDFKNLSNSIEKLRSEVNSLDMPKKKRLVPEKENLFAWTWACEFQEVRVVILGQDPYPGEGKAHGLAFSVMPDVRPLTNSLMSIYKEMNAEGFSTPDHGYLMGWARQGVLLLNAVLSLVVWDNIAQQSKQEKKEEMKQRKLWKSFTDAVISQLCENHTGLIFMLWGEDAKEKEDIILSHQKDDEKEQHVVLSTSHPSNFSASLGFKTCGHFQRCNEELAKKHKGQIEWTYLDKNI